MGNQEVHRRELEHHEHIYSGFAQSHFARPAVRAFRAHLADHILRCTGVSREANVLSLGCGIGDTELLLAPRVANVTGLDLSPAAIRQANADAAAAGTTNAKFIEGGLDAAPLEGQAFDLVIAIFLLHHLPDEELGALAARVASLLTPGGVFYSLDPSRYRLSGAVGRLVVPSLMAKHQSPDERELAPTGTRDLFERAGFDTAVAMYDFLSTPVAGLFPGAAWLYRAARLTDEVLVRLPLVRRFGSNFEIAGRLRPLP